MPVEQGRVHMARRSGEGLGVMTVLIRMREKLARRVHALATWLEPPVEMVDVAKRLRDAEWEATWNSVH